MLNLVKSWLLTKSVFTAVTFKCSCNIFGMVLHNLGLYVCLLWDHLRCLMQHMPCWWQISAILAQMSGVFHFGTGNTCFLALHFYIYITGYTICWSFPLDSWRYVELYWLMWTYFGALLMKWWWLWWNVRSWVNSEDDIWKRESYILHNLVKLFYEDCIILKDKSIFIFMVVDAM